MLKFPFDRRIIQVIGLAPAAVFFFTKVSFSIIYLYFFCEVALPKHHN